MDRRGSEHDIGRVRNGTLPEAPPAVLPPKPSALRRIGERVGRIVVPAALSGSILMGLATEADVQSAERIWPDNITVVEQVDSARLPDNPEEASQKRLLLVFGGLGQVRPKAAAEQIAEAKHAAGEDVAVAYVKYKNQGFDKLDEFGRADYEVLEAFIEDHNVKRIGIVGISMGLPTALEWFSQIVADAEAEGREIEWRIEEIISYSSPYDGQDPWKRNLLHWAAKSHYPGGLFSKFLYNLDFRRVLDFDISYDERMKALEEAVNKALNECSPQLFMSQVRLLANVDPSEWFPLLQKYTNNLVFIYMIGELPDDIVDAEQVSDRYFNLLGRIGNATLRLIVVAGAGHADTFQSANALREVMLQEYQLAEQEEEGEEILLTLQTAEEAGAEAEDSQG